MSWRPDHDGIAVAESRVDERLGFDCWVAQPSENDVSRQHYSRVSVCLLLTIFAHVEPFTSYLHF
jgi:hypothetical protein